MYYMSKRGGVPFFCITRVLSRNDCIRSKLRSTYSNVSSAYWISRWKDRRFNFISSDCWHSGSECNVTNEKGLEREWEKIYFWMEKSEDVSKNNLIPVLFPLRRFLHEFLPCLLGIDIYLIIVKYHLKFTIFHFFNKIKNYMLNVLPKLFHLGKLTQKWPKSFIKSVSRRRKSSFYAMISRATVSKLNSTTTSKVYGG